MAEELKVVTLESYLLSIEELFHQKKRGDSGKDNVVFFKYDLRNGRLDRYKGSHVAYLNGVLCGQHIYRDELYKQASSYYGKKGLAVFGVPNCEKRRLEHFLEIGVREAIGDVGEEERIVNL